MRAVVELAGAGDTLVSAAQLSEAQAIPAKVLDGVRTELRRAGLVQSQRGMDGGFCLARPPAEISLAEVSDAISSL